MKPRFQLYRSNRLNSVSFPVGGIGAGCIGIAGNGRLAEWEIFNEAGKFRHNGFSHFAVKAEKDGVVRDVRILQGDLNTFLSGEPTDMYAHDGFGKGADTASLCGFPHFSECEMEGAFPVAEYKFHDGRFPGRAKLAAWSPFVPGESDLASMPVAIFDITIENTTGESLDYSVAATLMPPWKEDNDLKCTAIEASGELTSLIMRNLPHDDSTACGEIAVTTNAEDVSSQASWYRGGWQDALEVFWHDMNSPGRLRLRNYDGKSRRLPGTLSAHFNLSAGASRTITYVISWYFPRRDNPAPHIDKATGLPVAGTAHITNYYATLCSSALDAASKLFSDIHRTRENVMLFRDAIHSSTIPQACLDGAAENLAVLISPTCLRLEDGTFWAWEGTDCRNGSCFGTCQHVWNYAQALPLLFPDLERSIRTSFLMHGFAPDGGFPFRLRIPVELPPKESRTCVDGGFGEVMKTYREWKVSGDTEWLKSLWPAVKRIISYAWSDCNPDRWDPERTGLICGRQHHTLDMELFGPSGWLNAHYLGALKAASEMGRACGDGDFAAICLEVFTRGRAETERLFNGEYFIQSINLKDKELLCSFAGKYDSEEAEEARKSILERYWDDEHGQIKYQFGEGCEIDSHLAQLYATLYGIGEILDGNMVHRTLNSIFKYNFKSMRDFCNAWRVFALNDEKGCVMCTWPREGTRPVIPLPYNSEVMTGFEWAAAAHLVIHGELEKGEAIAAAIRERYDGDKRNPWNEIECGSNYARSMAAFAMLQAYSGFRYDMTRGMIGFSPKINGDFRCFWSLGNAWGMFERVGNVSEIRLLHGSLLLKSIWTPCTAANLNGISLAGHANGDEWFAESPITLVANDVITLQ